MYQFFIDRVLLKMLLIVFNQLWDLFNQLILCQLRSLLLLLLLWSLLGENFGCRSLFWAHGWLRGASLLRRDSIGGLFWSFLLATSRARVGVSTHRSWEEVLLLNLMLMMLKCTLHNLWLSARSPLLRSHLRALIWRCPLHSTATNLFGILCSSHHHHGWRSDSSCLSLSY